MVLPVNCRRKAGRKKKFKRKAGADIFAPASPKPQGEKIPPALSSGKISDAAEDESSGFRCGGLSAELEGEA